MTDASDIDARYALARKYMRRRRAIAATIVGAVVVVALAVGGVKLKLFLDERACTQGVASGPLPGVRVWRDLTSAGGRTDVVTQAGAPTEGRVELAHDGRALYVRSTNGDLVVVAHRCAGVPE